MQIEVENKLTELQVDTLVVGVWCGGEEGKPELTASAQAVDNLGPPKSPFSTALPDWTSSA